MLENIRESSQGMAAKIILGLVILTFALAGIGSYTNSTDTSVADVNGEKISLQDFNKAYQAQRNNMQQQYGEMFETLAADQTYMANFRNGVVDSLINQRLVDQNSANLAIRVSDDRIKKTILTMPEFQVDGVFDNNRYLALINQAGFYQSSDFRDYLRLEMSRRQLTQALVLSEFSLPYQSTMIAELQNQIRDIRFASIGLEQFKSSVEITDEEINNFYQENQERFLNQEKVKVNYITLNVEDIAKNIVVSDDDVKAFYEENINDFGDDEQRRISHILIEVDEDEDAAKAQAESLLAQINAGGDFAELAKKYSSDTFSGENGGDLDWLERGSMDEVFDEQAFALAEIGDVSNVVQTEYGFHLIKLTDLKPAVVQPLTEVFDDLKIRISKQKAQEEFYVLQQEMARLSFEFPDSLDDAAEAVNTQVKTSEWLSRNNNTGVFSNVRAIDAAFSDLVLNEQLNSDVIEVSDSLAIVVRLNEYQAANVKPLAEVTEAIKYNLVAEKAKTEAQNVMDELLVEMQSGADITAKLVEYSTAFETKADVVRYSPEVAPAIVEKAFTLPHPVEGTVSAGLSDLANGDFVLVEVQAVKNMEAKLNSDIENQQVNQLAQSAYLAYVESLKEDASITKNTLVPSVN
ncbi:SurA N-terminal domain-containing protein [Pseudocolwellia sp. AS88]|uniref:SurA N-terminal domain-containing protein n=1 Tax=Pseudocolwellia sp. AS88 TaxID=3063958 RepID=UPI0026EFFD5D|nr:SurA N-terminal domain-containing protein [Pseudocolwellia sp. AS88]MDO7086773.1 SurA N-terminal domain-containing protein [Pseudocolwellia sp. AS88]